MAKNTWNYWKPDQSPESVINLPHVKDILNSQNTLVYVAQRLNDSPFKFQPLQINVIIEYDRQWSGHFVFRRSGSAGQILETIPIKVILNKKPDSSIHGWFQHIFKVLKGPTGEPAWHAWHFSGTWTCQIGCQCQCAFLFQSQFKFFQPNTLSNHLQCGDGFIIRKKANRPWVVSVGECHDAFSQWEPNSAHLKAVQETQYVAVALLARTKRTSKHVVKIGRVTTGVVSSALLCISVYLTPLYQWLPGVGMIDVFNGVSASGISLNLKPLTWCSQRWYHLFGYETRICHYYWALCMNPAWGLNWIALDARHLPEIPHAMPKSKTKFDHHKYLSSRRNRPKFFLRCRKIHCFG